MNGVLSQVNYGLARVQSDVQRPYKCTPRQKSFRQLPIGQALVTLVLLLATKVFFYGRRHNVDREWQNDNLTLRLLSIDPMQATGGQLCNATNEELKALDDFQLGACGQHLCLLIDGEPILDGQAYGTCVNAESDLE